MVKVGVSFVSIDQAKKNAMSEVAQFDFDGSRRAVVEAWNKELSAIRIEGGSSSERQQFATALYHTMLMPQRTNNAAVAS